jgi:hypothetical protein
MEFEIRVKGDSGNTAINKVEENELKNEIADLLFNHNLEPSEIIIYH